MRKIITALSLLSTYCTFSYYKMPDGTFFKYHDHKFEPIELFYGSSLKMDDGFVHKLKTSDAEIDKLFQNNFYNKVYIKYLNDKLSYATTYDKTLGYQLYCDVFDSSSIEQILAFYVFKRNKFYQQHWEKIFCTIQPSPRSYINNPLPLSAIPLRINYINTPINAISIEDLKNYYEDNAMKNPRNNLNPLILKPSISGIHINNSKSFVTINSPLNNIPIEFQPALLNYMKAQLKQQEDQLTDHVPRLVRDIKNPTLTQNNEFKADYISKIANASKTTYTQQQIDLLQNSKILAIWHIPPKEYTNKQYVEDWNKLHPEKEPKQIESKTINPIIIGFAYDTRDNMTYNWITDLGQDISILFNYAEELKTINTKK